MPGKFALIIGNSEYTDPNLTRLKAPEADVNALSALLRDPNIGAFDDVITLPNESSFTIRRAIARFFAQKSPDDLLLLYFSGHGVLDDRGELFLATKDTERDLIRGTAIPAKYITDEMDGSRSKRQVLMLDCCHSGAFARGTKGAVGASVGTASVFQGTGYGRVVLTATDATQFAWEGDQVIGNAENSLFTHYLIEGLQTGEADIDADGRITLDNLYDYVYGQVVKVTPKQTPGKWSYKQQGEIIIANNPKPVVQAAELPREIREAIASPLAGVREGVVRDLERLLSGRHPGLALAAYDALKELTEDDSRRVANAATQGIMEYETRTRSIAAQVDPALQARPSVLPDQSVREKIAVSPEKIEFSLSRTEKSNSTTLVGASFLGIGLAVIGASLILAFIYVQDLTIFYISGGLVTLIGIGLLALPAAKIKKPFGGALFAAGLTVIAFSFYRSQSYIFYLFPCYMFSVIIIALGIYILKKRAVY